MGSFDCSRCVCPVLNYNEGKPSVFVSRFGWCASCRSICKNQWFWSGIFSPRLSLWCDYGGIVCPKCRDKSSSDCMIQFHSQALAVGLVPAPTGYSCLQWSHHDLGGCNFGWRIEKDCFGKNRIGQHHHGNHFVLVIIQLGYSRPYCQIPVLLSDILSEGQNCVLPKSTQRNKISAYPQKILKPYRSGHLKKAFPIKD